MSFFSGITSSIASFFSLLRNSGAALQTKKAKKAKKTNKTYIYSPVPLDEKRIWAIRKREFQKLRPLLQKEMIDEDLPDQRFFHTSMLTDLSEKTSTLHKIDAIESQMSVQWLRTDRLDLKRRKKLPNSPANNRDNNLHIVLE